MVDDIQGLRILCSGKKKKKASARCTNAELKITAYGL